MSKKYIESMNKITVDDKLKKRILQKVSEVKEEDNNIKTVTPINRSKYNKMWTKSVGLVAACCAFVVCTSLNSRFPELFHKGNVNQNNENIENNDSEIDNGTISDESNKSENIINSEGISINNEDTSADKVEKTSKEENNYINNTGKETITNGAGNQAYQENKRSESGLSNHAVGQASIGSIEVSVSENNDYRENTEKIISENHDHNNEDYETASADYISSNHADNNTEENTSASTVIKSRETPVKIKEEFNIPEVIKNDAEITYTLLVSEDMMEVGYKYKGKGEGVLKISSHKIDNPEVKDYPKTEMLKTSNGEAVIMSNEDNNKRIAEWEINNKFYSLNTDSDCDNEEIIKIIESCR